MTLSILFFNARPKKYRFEIFPPFTGLPVSLSKEETSMIGNLLVVAVLVAGVTFAGAIQLPQLRDNNNSIHRRHESNSTTYEMLLNMYLLFDLGALSYSLVAALFLLLPSFSNPRFQIATVRFSTRLVRGAIYMMFVAFLLSVTIALIGSHSWLLILLIIIITGVAVVIPPIILLFVIEDVHLKVQWRHFYYGVFLVYFYRRWWLPNKLSDLKKKHNL